MNATAEALDNDNVKVTVTATPEEVDRAIAKAYADIATKVRIPGFRKGKVPRPVLDANVGRQTVLAQASEDLVSSVFPDAIEQLTLIPAEAADVDELDVVVPGEEFVFTATVLKRPEFSISSADGITVAVEPVAAEESQIDSQIEYLRERFAQLELVEDRGIEPGDFAVISFAGYVDGETYENNEVEAYLYELGRGQMPTEFDDALLGARPGDEIVAEFPIPDTSTKPEFVGRVARFDIKVSEVKAKALPPVDDEFAGSVGGFESVDELRADIRKRLEASKEETRKQAIELESRKALAERLEAEVPESLRTDRRNDMFADLERNLARQNMSFEEYCRLMGVSAADVEEDLRTQAQQAVSEDLALEALYRDKGLELAPDALDQELERLAVGYEMKPEEVRDTFTQRGLLPVIRLELMHRVAVDWLFENVEVVDKEADTEDEAAEPATSAKASGSGTKKRSKKPETAVPAPEPEDAADAGEPAESTEEDA